MPFCRSIRGVRAKPPELWTVELICFILPARLSTADNRGQDVVPPFSWPSRVGVTIRLRALDDGM